PYYQIYCGMGHCLRSAVCESFALCTEGIARILLIELLISLQDLLSEVSASTVEQASSALSLVLKVCNSHGVKQPSQETLHLLVTELGTPTAIVRKNVRTLLRLLAEVTGNDVSGQGFYFNLTNCVLRLPPCCDLLSTF